MKPVDKWALRGQAELDSTEFLKMNPGAAPHE